MEILQAYDLVNEKTGKIVQIVAYHEPGIKKITVVVTCHSCGEELIRRDFDTSEPDYAEISARAGWADAVVYGGHTCAKAGSC